MSQQSKCDEGTIGSNRNLRADIIAETKPNSTIRESNCDQSPKHLKPKQTREVVAHNDAELERESVIIVVVVDAVLCAVCSSNRIVERLACRTRSHIATPYRRSDCARRQSCHSHR
jgi:hypothetical protein